MRGSVFALGLLAALAAAGARAQTEEATEPPKQEWSFDGVFGSYDRAAAQRGFQVYNEVCANCHAMKLLSYRDLSALGFSEDEVKAIAAAKQVTNEEPNDQGEMFQRPARPSDRFVSPFANEQAARAANNGALPPDLSLMVKARAGGPDYAYGILTGYQEPPANLKLAEAMTYNEYFPGHQIAMPQPLNDNSVTYADGTPAMLDQEAHDVVTFLAWAAEPNLEDRHRTGLKTILFLLAMSGVLYASKRRIWAELH